MVYTTRDWNLWEGLNKGTWYDEPVIRGYVKLHTESIVSSILKVCTVFTERNNKRETVELKIKLGYRTELKSRFPPQIDQSPVHN